MSKITSQQKVFLSNFKGLILDVDGVLFSGLETRSVVSSGEFIVSKTRSLIDGQGISFLRAVGIKILFASGENEPLRSIVAKLNQLPSVISGDWEHVECFTDQLGKGGKTEVINMWLTKHDLTWSDCAYIGDDRTDLEAMQLAGLKVTPANGTRVVKRIAELVLESKGGNGAIREFSELVLDSRGVDEATLPSA